MLGVSTKEFWRENGGGGGGGWGTNTLVVLLVLFICQLAAKTRFWLWFRLLLFPNPNIPSRSISPDLKNSPPFPTINSQFRISEIISDLDLKNLIDNLDENSHKHPKWDSVIDRRNSLIAYSAKCCKPKDGPLKYLSVTIFDNCSAESLRDFYMDNNYRKNWDKTLIEHEQLQVNESNGTEIGRIIKKFPLLTAREYLLAWRVWESKDGTFYCFSKECEHPLAPRQKKYVRVELFRSGWRIRKVPGTNSCEIKMVHQENAGLNVEMAKLAFAKGIWSYVCKMDNALRKYSAANCPQSSLGITAVTLIQKVPLELDTIANITDPAFPETSGASSSCCQIAREGSERKFSRRPSNKLIANGLILLGGAICMSRGHSNLGAKVAIAYVLTKLTKRGASLNQSKPA
ncbi:StAR-related lipid transfer protein like [Actinidia chinensis var. chinensis]|uniref:StAR-related lipid transfer protein like n=1 Tax=Actinidia chinensis var. chinensis TaxID=1590841 RepID=A0A2R6R0N8_ACTCC|nr:StAR-related lipid transfer protein like [Actinidia chinensis var. chinensis]